MRRALVSSAVAAATFLLVSSAAAYCRTTTVSVPPGYDPTLNGCIDQGTPLFWPSMPVTYEMHSTASTQLTLDEATPVLDAAFAAWAQVSCSASDPTKHPELSFQRLTPTDDPFIQCDAQACEQMEAAGPHQIIFRDDAWPYDDSANTIALTTVTYGVETGRMHSANMEINSHDYRFTTVDPPADGTTSLSAVVRHEAGHFIGLAHAEDRSAVMFAFYQPNVMSLTQDDIDGVCAIYPPASPSGCACTTGGHEGSALSVLGFSVMALAAARARRRKS